MKELNKLRLKEEIEYVVEKALKKNIFSGACVSFSKSGRNFKWRESYSYGYTTKFESGKRVGKKTYFDLASLTKPLVTVLSVAVLIEKGKLDLHDRLSDCSGLSFSGDKKNIKISHLLSHSSGLPAHKPYYKQLVNVHLLKKKETIINWIKGEDICFLPGTNTLYSDLGFILLGFLIEDITGMPLDVFWEENVIAELNLQKELLFPKNKQIDPDICVATQNFKSDDNLLIGIVNDSNCRAMGGVAGHAGLFGTGTAVLSLCEHILEQAKGNERKKIYSSSILVKLLERKGKSSWSYGFDTPTEGCSSSGLYFSDKSRGHLGFTGTSFWIDFDKNIVISVLTNRVHLSNDISGIREFRPLIHNTIMNTLSRFH